MQLVVKRKLSLNFSSHACIDLTNIVDYFISIKVKKNICSRKILF